MQVRTCRAQRLVREALLQKFRAIRIFRQNIMRCVSRGAEVAEGGPSQYLAVLSQAVKRRKVSDAARTELGQETRRHTVASQLQGIIPARTNTVYGVPSPAQPIDSVSSSLRAHPLASYQPAQTVSPHRDHQQYP